MTLKESTAQDTALAAKASPQVPDQGSENDGKKQHSKAFLVLAAMGPGIVTAMAGNDAGGISTYSTVGAKFGYMTLWIIPVMCVLLIVVQTTATRMGVVTGKGFSALIRESFGIRLTALAMLALLIGNVATTFSEFAGVASGMEIFGVPRWISVPVAAAAVWGLIVGGSYTPPTSSRPSWHNPIGTKPSSTPWCQQQVRIWASFRLPSQWLAPLSPLG